jgi:hypothetical protein
MIHMKGKGKIAELRTGQKHVEKQRHEDRREDWKALREEKMRQARQRRESLIGRLAKAKEHRHAEESMRKQKHQTIVEEIDLRKQEATDVRMAEEGEKRAMRKSIGTRLKVWRDQRAMDAEMIGKRKAEEDEHREKQRQDKEDTRMLMYV